MNKYPDGDAGAVRQHAFARLFMKMGYGVKVIGYGPSTGFKYKNYCDVDYISLRGSKTGLADKVLDRLRFHSRLKKEILQMRPDLIFVVDLPFVSMRYLSEYAYKNNLTIIHDSVEWYSAEEFRLGKLDMSYIRKNLLNTRVINRKFKVVSISSYLCDYYNSKGIDSVRIPFVLNMEPLEFCKKNEDKIVVSYAGTPLRKDDFKTVFDGLNLLDDSQLSRIELRIIGCNKESVLSFNNYSNEDFERIGRCVRFTGRIPREEVLENMKSANFTILMRNPKLRHTKAGFPTKVTESLTHYTPVIANLTSDLDMILQDGVNSIIVKDFSKEAVADAFRRALELDCSQLSDMCFAARRTAEEKLDISLYEAELQSLIE